MKLRFPNLITIYSNKQKDFWDSKNINFEDISVDFKFNGENLAVSLEADISPVSYIRLRWNFTEQEKRKEPVRIFGDEWERTYAQAGWRSIDATHCMPWVFMVSNGSDSDDNNLGRHTECFGVKVRPSALCFWQYDVSGVTLWLDTQSGSRGVKLNGRRLEICEIVFADYYDVSAFSAGKMYYKTLCDDMLTVNHKVYGVNNWYYAYGHSSQNDIFTDTALLRECTKENKNAPYMVIDSCWEHNGGDAPWNELRDGFCDMKKLADNIKALGARPGIWFRPLTDRSHLLDLKESEVRAKWNQDFLDASHPKVLEYVSKTVKMLSQEWGYELIKHDFSTYDIFGKWGFECPHSMNTEGLSFYDESKTSAEIVVNLYKTILDAAGKNTLILGCNVIGHLAAGLVHLNRVGDDTSGYDWELTRNRGVNTLAFRMLHHNNFYLSDADCVGITKNIDFYLNGQWLKILSVSGTPLFVSPKPECVTSQIKEELIKAYKLNSVQKNTLEPIDWMENFCPEYWRIDGKKVRFDWYSQYGARNFEPIITK